jgi:DNA-directed RNA polymerase subunit L|tara:strand:- start:498 stop:653 length:156 start_codon:yes stop_codon:yes gene_type:complete
MNKIKIEVPEKFKSMVTEVYMEVEDATCPPLLRATLMDETEVLVWDLEDLL